MSIDFDGQTRQRFREPARWRRRRSPTARRRRESDQRGRPERVHRPRRRRARNRERPPNQRAGTRRDRRRGPARTRRSRCRSGHLLQCRKRRPAEFRPRRERRRPTESNPSVRVRPRGPRPALGRRGVAGHSRPVTRYVSFRNEIRLQVILYTSKRRFEVADRATGRARRDGPPDAQPHGPLWMGAFRAFLTVAPTGVVVVTVRSEQTGTVETPNPIQGRSAPRTITFTRATASKSRSRYTNWRTSSAGPSQKAVSMHHSPRWT